MCVTVDEGGDVFADAHAVGVGLVDEEVFGVAVEAEVEGGVGVGVGSFGWAAGALGGGVLHGGYGS